MYFPYKNPDESDSYRERVKQEYQAAQHTWQLVRSQLARITSKLKTINFLFIV